LPPLRGGEGARQRGEGAVTSGTVTRSAMRQRPNLSQRRSASFTAAAAKYAALAPSMAFIGSE
jgi:hypothetical protein